MQQWLYEAPRIEAPSILSLLFCSHFSIRSPSVSKGNTSVFKDELYKLHSPSEAMQGAGFVMDTCLLDSLMSNQM